MKRRVVAVGVVLSLAVGACGSDEPSSAPAATPTSAAVVDETAVTESAPTFLGERESSFGPGSHLVAVSPVAERIGNMSTDGGEWFDYPPFAYEPEDARCGYATPIALEGQSQSRESPTDAPFTDTVGVQVMIYADEATAAAEVAVLNGPNAEACDAVSAAALKEGMAASETAPGVKMDVGDGLGDAIEVPFDHPNAAARRFQGTLSIGSESRPADVIEWVLADGPVVVRGSVFSLTGKVDELAVELADVMLADEFPGLVEDPAVDEAVEVVRRAVLEPDALPSYFDEADPVEFIATSPRTECYDVVPDFMASGPGWLAITPGVGGSRVQQSTLVFPSAEIATRAVEELIAAGAGCYVEVVALPEPMFTLQDSSVTTEMVGDREAVNVQLDYVQTINGTDFDADAHMSVVQDGRYVFVFEFFGLAGDSPNLAELAGQAADRAAS